MVSAPIYRNDLEMRFVCVSPGSFMMGSPESEIGREPDETMHRVDLTVPYYLQDTPVTNHQFRAWKPEHSSGKFRGVDLNGDDHPVVLVSWEDAVSFAEWLSESDNKFRYRLPTEAEWEYAARSGSSGLYWWGSDPCQMSKYANVYDLTAAEAFVDMPKDNFNIRDCYSATSPVRSYLPNPWGFYDMIGNVWEMCGNWAYKYPATAGAVLTDPKGPSQGALKTIRGGDFLSIFFFARIANRAWTKVTDRVNSMGFRLCATPKGAPLSIEANSTLLDLYACAADIYDGEPTWEAGIKQMFTQTDIEHMLQASSTWKPPMDLGDYTYVSRFAVKIYSSVRDNPPRMPLPPSNPWSHEMKMRFFKWIIAGCPER
ncbi:SUMF1/EgtB/PvdO family nonheme iron enzyme [Azospirillum brasilense]|uniref:formylglycine-generating enzyme family protein n=1 Tax=Azospirillum brasilense TaxID=192 RepID=UPI0019090A23|nr:formylglycine-generating enzyme family protein [Azospirillum brasilense]MBK3734258.1 SUMF1/EgtB/PvdO family nonheme iron enzyme [Azospirillum brasilense]